MPPTADAAPVRNFRSLHDVAGDVPTDGALYMYDAASGLMKPQSELKIVCRVVNDNAEAAATALLRGEPLYVISGTNVIAKVGDGVMATDGLQYGGNVWPGSDVYARYDPTAAGGAGSGDGTAITQLGVQKFKSGVTDAGMDQRTQGRGFFRVRGLTDGVPGTAPGINSIDLQIKRTGAVGAQEQSQYAMGEDINVLARGCVAFGGAHTCDVISTLSPAGRATFQYQTTVGWNNKTGGIKVTNSGYGNMVYSGGADPVSAYGSLIIAGDPAAGMGSGHTSGYKTRIYGDRVSAFGHSSGAFGQPSSTVQRRSPVTISTVAGVTTVTLSISGDFSSGFYIGTIVVLWGFNASNDSSGTNGWVWVTTPASSSYNAGTGFTSLVLVDAIPNAAITAGLIDLFTNANSQGSNHVSGHNCFALARRAAAYGVGGVAAVDNTHNIGGPHCGRKDFGDIDPASTSEAFRALHTPLETFYSPLVDFTVVGVKPQMSIPANSVFFPHECGVEIRAEFNAVTVQPTVKMGISGNTAKHRAAAITTQLTAANRQDKAAVTTNDGETSLQGEVTVAATATTCKGYFFWTGRLVQTG